ncbi:GCN5 family acetyltransferase [Enterococcus sp. JM4C]|uniref:GNAT family N-acetyltransferase n=1 Tax=Candidatus Enterococcus huntleyi TaxID=1857217 RepID=UPI00192A465D|nr:GNAT family N-acetyltransferase [Enterococcus sp. JM4C]KAF1296927.1 GCN5 family acetyltransferase [Enterococcus sp. JM4C]
MTLRRAEKADCPEIMKIIQQAKAFLAHQGSPQWQNGYGPTEEAILKDIEKGESYVLVVDNQIVGTAALVSGIDPVYTAITEGNWQTTDTAYLSIHRVAIDGTIRGRGLAKELLTGLIQEASAMGIHDIRIDTYPKNEPMEKAIFASGFTYQGEVEFPIPHGERKAYQYLV